jgi:hypothetical protein
MEMLQLSQPRVILDYSQETEAHRIGFLRVTESTQKVDDPWRWNSKTNYHEMVGEMAEACGAEWAVAMYFGIKNYELSVNTFKNQADVGNRVEVKWSKYTNGHLILHERDRINDVAVFVTGRSPVYDLMGWIPVHMAKVPKYYNPIQRNWWVTQRNLFPMKDLRNSIYGSNPSI